MRSAADAPGFASPFWKAFFNLRATGVQVISEKNKTAIAFIHDDQLSLAIGKEGQNARLAAKLTGWKIGIESTEAHAKKVAAEGK